MDCHPERPESAAADGASRRICGCSSFEGRVSGAPEPAMSEAEESLKIGDSREINAPLPGRMLKLVS
jgi:hypothetical protein